MHKVIVGILVVVVVLSGLGIGLVSGYLDFSNGANRYEADIPAQYNQMKNVYDNGWKEVMEKNQIPQNYADQVKDIFQATMTGRYGKDGSKAIFQLIKEDNPKVDPSLYKGISESIEKFHAQFSASQQQIIAIKQSYQTYLTATTNGRFYNLFSSYPHIKCGIPTGAADDFQIVTSGKTETDFQNHKADILDLTKRK